MANITIMCGSVFGAAQDLAELIKSTLSERSHNVTFNIPCSTPDMENAEAILIVTSTTGQGELPSNIEPFYFNAKNNMPMQTGKLFGVICLGDSSYTTYGQAGDLMQELFIELQAKEAFPMLKVDAVQTLEPETLALPWLEQWMKRL
ncbi:flavodoxin domain-containing protein [uncultured Psychrosphaera sp.]|uniref:flavodoxin domain-containing protein n=1 Tax=uncultured Psychrosphaera sp. TaxID=1403522 RepID=UPI0030F7B500